jgi:hypothetical protein
MAHICKECGEPVGLGTVDGEIGPSYSELLVRNQILMNAIASRYVVTHSPADLVSDIAQIDATLKQSEQ